VDSSIANNGATFQGKSAKGNTGCVQSKMVAVMVVNAAKPPWVEQLDWADEILYKNSRLCNRANSTEIPCVVNRWAGTPKFWSVESGRTRVNIDWDH